MLFINLSAMSFINSVLDWVVPPASLVMLACSWPALCFINTCEWLYKSFFSEDMEDKVVIITGASSGIGEVSNPLPSQSIGEISRFYLFSVLYLQI
jgi:hypothetical protein